MSNLRSYVDGLITPTVEQDAAEFKTGDQVVLKRKVGRSHLSVKEVMCGTITSLSGEGQATVTLARPFGRILRTTVSLDELQPASSIYKRSRVNVNPAFRQTYLGRV